MSIVKLNGIADIQEAKLPPEGRYDLVCLKADLQEKEGKSSIRLILSVEDTDENYANLFSYIGLPGPGDDGEKVAQKLLFAKRTLYWLGMDDVIEDGELDLSALPGCQTRIPIPVVPSEYEGREGRNVNWPNLPTEG